MPAPRKRSEEDESSIPHSPKQQPVPNRVPAGPLLLSRGPKGRSGMSMLPEDREVVPEQPMKSGECFRLRQVSVEALLQDGTLGLLLHGTSVVGFCSEDAATHGWRVGDQIVEINGRRVAAFEEFLERFLAAQLQGFPITFSVLRREIPDDEGKDPLDNFFNETKFVDLASQLKNKFGSSEPRKAPSPTGESIMENPYIQALRKRRSELSRSPEGWSDEGEYPSLAAQMASERCDALATLSKASDTPRRFDREPKEPLGTMGLSTCISAFRPCRGEEEFRTTPRRDCDYEMDAKVPAPNAVILSARGELSQGDR
ncbi:unnamed protein product [Effrenium voratum]|nr:unnamed protein product [Effrenium voratum]CAJ1420674.1 unnamed protein product [Effrenium voratum]